MVTVEFFGGPWDGERKEVQGPLKDDWLVPLKGDWPEEMLDQLDPTTRRVGRVGRYVLGYGVEDGAFPYHYDGEL